MRGAKGREGTGQRKRARKQEGATIELDVDPFSDDLTERPGAMELLRAGVAATPELRAGLSTAIGLSVANAAWRPRTCRAAARTRARWPLRWFPIPPTRHSFPARLGSIL